MTPTRVWTATPTATATATPTEEPEGPQIHFGSTAVGSGMLALADDVDYMVRVFFTACIGGTGPNCEGGALVYEASAPGFPAIEEDEPQQPLYHLVDGTVIFKITKGRHTPAAANPPAGFQVGVS